MYLDKDITGKNDDKKDNDVNINEQEVETDSEQDILSIDSCKRINQHTYNEMISSLPAIVYNR